MTIENLPSASYVRDVADNLMEEKKFDDHVVKAFNKYKQIERERFIQSSLAEFEHLNQENAELEKDIEFGETYAQQTVQITKVVVECESGGHTFFVKMNEEVSKVKEEIML